MNNDYKFWNEYLKNTIKKIKEKLESTEELYVDLHIHSYYSADSDVTLNQIIERSKSKKLDIISITDHDNVGIYDDLYEYLKTNSLDDLIIIPGIEFTIDNKEYGSQFHIVQSMINPKDKQIIENIKHQDEANWNRAKIQLDRLHINKVAQYYFEKYNFDCNYEGYKKFLKTFYKPIPEYFTIMKYIQNEFNNNKIYNWEILEKMQEENAKDKCISRKELREKEFERLRQKYENDSESKYNSRMFHCMFAVRKSDDDYFKEYDPVGDLSVNNYGELKLGEINKNNLTIFAHPTENKLYLLKDFVKINNNIKGIEDNTRNEYKDHNNFIVCQKELGLIRTVGSDIHDLDSDLYNDMSLYKMNKQEMLDYLECVNSYIENA